MLTVSELLEKLGLADLKPIFEQENINPLDLEDLTKEDLIAMGVTRYKQRKAILEAIKDGSWKTESSKQNPEVVDGKLYGQDFEKLKAELLSKESFSLFKDDKFRPEDLGEKVEWRRPFELCDSPAFFKDGVTRFDVKQGKLGDCWMVAAMASLSLPEHREKFDQVVPASQSFNKREYAGIFHFRFWRYGVWVSVVVDDLLPCQPDGKTLFFMKSDDPEEFWSALLEKAYAKLHGSYKNLDGGLSTDSLVIFTGGSPQRFNVADMVAAGKSEELFNTLLDCYSRNAIICSDILSENQADQQAKESQGLVTDHAYSVTKVLKLEEGKYFVRARNPHGGGEWTGAWADGGKEWKTLSEADIEKFGLKKDEDGRLFPHGNVVNDGEFWIEWSDFLKNFSQINICHSKIEDVVQLKKGRELEKFEWSGEWEPNKSAGGSLSTKHDYESYASNPQYHFSVPTSETSEGKRKIFVSLMQKNRRALQKGCHLPIGFKIYKEKEKKEEKQEEGKKEDEPEKQKEAKKEEKEVKKLDQHYFKQNPPVCDSGLYSSEREVTGVFSMEPANYIIVPSSYVTAAQGEFYLRVFVERDVKKDE